MLYASLERPPFSGAKVKSFQENKAGAVGGVVGDQIGAWNRCCREFYLGGGGREPGPRSAVNGVSRQKTLSIRTPIGENSKPRHAKRDLNPPLCRYTRVSVRALLHPHRRHAPFLDAPEGATGFAVAPEGERIAFQADDEAGHPQIFVMSADGTDRRQVSHEPLAAESPGWSPDGARFAFRGLAPDSTYEIYVLDVASGESNRITREKQDVATGYTDQPSWSEDGRTIVFQVEDVIRSIDVETGASSTIIEDAGIPTSPRTGARSRSTPGRPRG